MRGQSGFLDPNGTLLQARFSCKIEQHQPRNLFTGELTEVGDPMPRLPTRLNWRANWWSLSDVSGRHRGIDADIRLHTDPGVLLLAVCVARGKVG